MRADRLLKLADHLKHGKLGHAVFDYDVMNMNRNMDGRAYCLPPPHTCGSNGCALGELPFCFPDEWEFDSNGIPVLKKNKNQICDWIQFFDISEKDMQFIFYPRQNSEDNPDGLPKGATSYDVAKRIRAFISKETPQ